SRRDLSRHLRRSRPRQIPARVRDAEAVSPARPAGADERVRRLTTVRSPGPAPHRPSLKTEREEFGVGYFEPDFPERCSVICFADRRSGVPGYRVANVVRYDRHAVVKAATGKDVAVGIADRHAYCAALAAAVDP